jgi:glycerol uptake facilitator protein
MWSQMLAEMIGSTILLTMGFGSVATDLLEKSYGKKGGWLMGATGWGIGLGMAIITAITLGSQGHVNPAVTIGLASAGLFAWTDVPYYITAQVTGGILAGIIVWLVYLPHWEATEDAETKRACFAMIPAIRAPAANVTSEAIAMFVFMFGIFVIIKKVFPISDIAGSLLTGAWLWAVLVAFGGQTALGLSIDFGTRIAHAILPISGKGPSDWSYAWVPVLGPFVGAAAAGYLSIMLGMFAT